MIDFDIRAGSVIGRDHRKIGKNNQDAYYIAQNDDTLVAIVADGCGDPSSPFSEVGSRIGAKLVATTVLQFAKNYECCDQSFFNDVLDSVLRDIVKISDHIDPYNEGNTLKDMFLFTIVGVIIRKDISVFFTLGDGVIRINGLQIKMSKYDNNAPPYIVYNLMKSSLVAFEPTSIIIFNIRAVLSTKNLNSFLIGTDGVDYLTDVSEFWTDSKLFENVNAVNNRLAAINRDTQTIDWESYSINKHNGPLVDDTTLICGKRII